MPDIRFSEDKLLVKVKMHLRKSEFSDLLFFKPKKKFNHATE